MGKPLQFVTARSRCLPIFSSTVVRSSTRPSRRRANTSSFTATRAKPRRKPKSTRRSSAALLLRTKSTLVSRERQEILWYLESSFGYRVQGRQGTEEDGRHGPGGHEGDHGDASIGLKESHLVDLRPL